MLIYHPLLYDKQDVLRALRTESIHLLPKTSTHTYIMDFAIFRLLVSVRCPGR